MRKPKPSVSAKIEQSVLSAAATEGDVLRACDEARRLGFYGVCVNPFHIETAKDALRGSPVKIISVVAFPLGATPAEVKVFEAKKAALSGADELDIVMNICHAKQGRWDALEKELAAIVMATPRLVHKVIIETALLSRAEKKRAVEAALSAGAEFIKTSTGYAPAGATVEDVVFLRKIIGGRAGIKASGGIRSYKAAIELVEAGADRLGTSAGPQIVKEEKKIKKGLA